MKAFDIVVDVDGTAQAIYDDAIAPVFADADPLIRRASHVEPHRGGWIVDMRPVGGPVFGTNGIASQPLRSLAPFVTRQAALDSEVAWLCAAMTRGVLRFVD